MLGAQRCSPHEPIGRRWICTFRRIKWHARAEDELDLIVASMTTNVTIKLAQRAESEFDLVVARPKSYPADTFPVWRLLGTILKPPMDDASSKSTADQPANTFWPTYVGL
jgi:hypothetical protein